MRASINKNLTPYYESEYEALPVYTGRGPLAKEYLTKIDKLLAGYLKLYPRTLAVRVDLHLPKNIKVGPDVISKFTASVKSKIDAETSRKVEAGERVHPCVLGFVWCKEQAIAEQPHYHVLLLLNRDRHRRLGNFEFVESKYLSTKIAEAWASALNRMDISEAKGLVHFPKNAVYDLNTNNHDFPSRYKDLFLRASYLAKLDTKKYGEGLHAFGCSRL